MKNYIKHLKENPLKIIWLIFIWSFAALFAIVLILGKEVIIEDNSLFVYRCLWLFLWIIFIVANYQPYKEYKDGL